MAQLNVYLEAESPLVLGGGFAIGNVQTSRPYVAGSVWRGAVAGVILDELGLRRRDGLLEDSQKRDDRFDKLFLGEQAPRFGYLYPVREHADELQAASTFPMPLTARTCKLNPGFMPKGDGVYDGLLNRIREVAAGEVLYKRGLGKCPTCDGRLERTRGATSRQNAKYDKTSISTRSFVRVGLNRYTETAQQSILYVLDALVPGPGGDEAEKPITFVGTWHGTSAQKALLESLLDQALFPDRTKGFTFRIGTARARGMGKVTLRFAPPQQSQKMLKKRLKKFQPNDHCEHQYAALTLRSPLQLLDERGLPATQLTATILRDYYPNLPDGLELLEQCSVVERENISGWAAAWGLPKPVTSAFSAGSVLVLRTPTSQRANLLKWLTQVEEEGMGERRAEGWGEVLVCDSFHIIYDEKQYM